MAKGRFSPATGSATLCGVLVETDDISGKSVSIKPFKLGGKIAQLRMNVSLIPYIILILMGAAWGLSIPLTKITVSTGYGQFGLIFWQFVIAVIVLGFVLIVRRKRPLFERKTIFLFIVLALLGTIFPNSASYVATYYLPASFIAILIATVPMFSFPIAMLMGLEKKDFRRISGLFIGLIGVVILTGPERASQIDIYLFLYHWRF